MRYYYPESDPLYKEKQAVMDRMHGCGDIDCAACKENFRSLERLVEAAKKLSDKK